LFGLRARRATACECFNRLAPAANKTRSGPPAALPGADVWKHAWGGGAHCSCAARHAAFNDHISPLCAKKDNFRKGGGEGTQAGTAQANARTFCLEKPRIILTPLYSSGFCSKLRAPSPSVRVCVWGGGLSRGGAAAPRRRGLTNPPPPPHEKAAHCFFARCC
jgi:hypothetical protein